MSRLMLKLEYLPFRAMAETTRFLLAYGNISYRDEVVWGQTFASRRARRQYPFNKVPVLHVGTDIIAQSGSMARLAAKMAGCYPEDPVEAARSDFVFEFAQ